MRQEVLTGLERLTAVTALLHRIRLKEPRGGVWEAADLQWWWRQPRASDRCDQVVWLDDRRQPVGAAVLTDWARVWGLDVITLPDTGDELEAAMWQAAFDHMSELGLGPVEILARDDDMTARHALGTAGFAPTGEAGAATWLDADRRPTVAPAPLRFRLRSRTETADHPHHMVGRSGTGVAERLAQCSLYDPHLDLWVQAPNGDVAGYGLFWADPVTGVGLVEPMRTEDGYQRRGLARHLLTAGLEGLASRGCRRLKVSYEADNPAARDLYLGVGFVPESTSRAYRARPA